MRLLDTYTVSLPGTPGPEIVYEIVCVQPDDSGLYRRLGPFATDRQVLKELEGPIYHDLHTVWLFAYHGREIVALSGVRFDSVETASFTLTYVLPDHRRRGLYRSMFGLKLALCQERAVATVKGLANPLSAALFREHDFVEVGQRGKWTHFAKEIKEAVHVQPV